MKWYVFVPVGCSGWSRDRHLSEDGKVTLCGEEIRGLTHEWKLLTRPAKHRSDCEECLKEKRK